MTEYFTSLLDFSIAHLDYLATIFVLVGYFRMNAKAIDGWIYTGIGSTLYVIFGFFIGDASGLALGNIIFIILSIRGFRKWRKEAQ